LASGQKLLQLPVVLQLFRHVVDLRQDTRNRIRVRFLKGWDCPDSLQSLWGPQFQGMSVGAWTVKGEQNTV